MNENIRAQTCCKGMWPNNIVLYLDTVSLNWVQFSLEPYSGAVWESCVLVFTHSNEENRYPENRS